MIINKSGKFSHLSKRISGKTAADNRVSYFS